jgi:putative transposase
VDQDGDIIDVYLQTRRDAEAARRFFRRPLSSHGKSPWKIVTDKLGNYGVARRELMPAAFYGFRQDHAFDRWNEAVTA